MHQVTVSKDIAYGTIKCIIDFTYGLPSGQPSVNPQSYSTVPKNGYAIVITNVTKSQGDPTNITYSYSIYQNTVRVTTGYFRIAFYNNGTYNVLDYWGYISKQLNPEHDSNTGLASVTIMFQYKLSYTIYNLIHMFGQSDFL